MTEQSKEYDVAILGWWYGKNYGSILTYLGLNRAITELGYRVLMVHEPLGYNGARVEWPNDILSMNFARRMGYNVTEQFHYSKLPNLNEKADTFVVGSDQLWNPLIPRVNYDLFLDFVSDDNKRIAYATSFGNKSVGGNKWKPDFIFKGTNNLNQFDAISVRESYAVDIAKSVFGVNASQVIDPVFLVDRQYYIELAEQATVKVQGKYLVLFFLDITFEKRRVAEAIANKLGLEKIVVLPNPDNGRDIANKVFDGDRFEILAEDSPENWLYAYYNSEYVLTDSFHGTAFATIFEKPFSSIYNQKRGADRFENVLNMLGFAENERRVYETSTQEEIYENGNVSFSLDYSLVRERAKVESEKSHGWLKSALEKPREKLSGEILATSAIGDQFTIDKPKFVTNNMTWDVSIDEKAAHLDLNSKKFAVKGNQVWCDLPVKLFPKEGYKVSVKWSLRTDNKSINLHIRNPETGKFKVIGTIATKGKASDLHEDSVSFIVDEEGFSQFMLGAIHFTGDNAGADVVSIAVEHIPAKDVSSERPQAKKKAKSPISTARELSQADHSRFVNSYAVGGVAKNIANSRAILMFHSHAYEKGLSRNKDFRPGFGKATMPKFAREMNQWLEKGHSKDDPFFLIAADVLRSYFQRHNQIGVDVSHFYKLFNSDVQNAIENANGDIGGVLNVKADRELQIDNIEHRNFVDVVFNRRSVREFVDKSVDESDIRGALKIALQAPSVCNRQSARVYQFDDKNLMSEALKLQGGFSGYESPPKLLLVTCDLSAYVFATERNQGFIDGGIFMMLLLLGLEQMGLGACPLNTAMGKERDQAARKLLSIPENEVFIAFIAVGHVDSDTLIPRSKRLSVDEILVTR